MSPSDYFLFPNIKTHIHGYHLKIFKNVQQVVTNQLKAESVADFQHYF